MLLVFIFVGYFPQVFHPLWHLFLALGQLKPTAVASVGTMRLAWVCTVTPPGAAVDVPTEMPSRGVFNHYIMRINI
jgi:hypothetical protein